MDNIPPPRPTMKNLSPPDLSMYDISPILSRASSPAPEYQWILEIEDPFLRRQGILTYIWSCMSTVNPGVEKPLEDQLIHLYIELCHEVSTIQKYGAEIFGELRQALKTKDKYPWEVQPETAAFEWWVYLFLKIALVFQAYEDQVSDIRHVVPKVDEYLSNYIFNTKLWEGKERGSFETAARMIEGMEAQLDKEQSQLPRVLREK